jgi:FkbM family methyltransferase
MKEFQDSHTAQLVEEALDKVYEYSHRFYIEELEKSSKRLRKTSLRTQHKGHVVNRILKRFGLYLTYAPVKRYHYDSMCKWSCIGTFLLALKNPREFDWVRELLDDDESKSIFDWFVKYRVAYAFLGRFADDIFPPPVTEEEFRRGMDSLSYHGDTFHIGGFKIKTNIGEMTTSWVFKQYELKGCEVEEGDYVLEGGAYEGGTSLWFVANGAGKVYAFEPDPHNFSVLLENIRRNRLSDKIIPFQKALSRSEGRLRFSATGTGGSKASDSGNLTVESVALDELLEKNFVERVDFIKLDVEGSELEVLEGGTETIKKFKPKMAISVYHTPKDIIDITKLVSQLLPKAKLYLSHKNSTLSETILFVNPRGKETTR